MPARGAVFIGPAAMFAVASLTACDPYERRQGEFYAGVVDPAKFQKPYLGDGGSATRAGSGSFAPIAAQVGGKEVFYYSLPMPASQAGLDDPLLLGDDLAPPNAYVFDPRADRPFPDKQRCQAPDGYRFDQQTEGFRGDEQGNVFSLLPSDAAYVPLVEQVAITSMGEPCQSIKSWETLRLRDKGDVSVGQPAGKLLAWAVIDPAADVAAPTDTPDAEGNLPKETALGPQRWGWFDHYLLAYLDGGYVPTTQTAMGARLVAQKLYFPKTIPITDDMGMVTLGPGAAGDGFDVLEGARGGAGYSPICQVLSYEPADPMKPATDVGQIDQMTVEDQGLYVYCLQLQ